MEVLPKSRGEARAAGAPRYFTGKPCKYGHLSPRLTKGTCCQCKIVQGREYMTRRYRANPEFFAAKQREHRANLTLEQRERRNARSREYKKKWKKQWWKTPGAARSRLTDNIRRRIRHAVFSTNNKKHGKTVALLGCTVPEYRAHLEKKFVDGMSWDNYGVWHVDHIVPVSRFNLATLKGQKAAFNYKNTQPLWGPDNLRKGAR